MFIENPLFRIISAQNQKNPYLISENKSNLRFCSLKSQKYPDFNFVLHQRKDGFIVEFFSATFDFLSKSPIELEELNQGLALFFDGKYEPNCDEICNYFKWNV